MYFFMPFLKYRFRPTYNLKILWVIKVFKKINEKAYFRAMFLLLIFKTLIIVLKHSLIITLNKKNL